MPPEMNSASPYWGGTDDWLLPVNLGIVGAVLGIVYLTTLRFFSQSKAGDIAAFGLLFGVLPIIVGAAAAWNFTPSGKWRTFGKLFVASAMIAVLAMALLPWRGLAIVSYRHLGDIVPIIAGIGAVLALASLSRLSAYRSAAARGRLELMVERCLAVGFFALLILFSPFDRASTIPSAMVGYFIGTRFFIIWVLAGCLFCSGIVWLYRHEALLFLNNRIRFNATALAVAVIVTLALYDDSHFIDLAHYAPYVGAALFAHAGGAPMVDVYSVYGLIPWLLVWLGYEVISPTLGTTAIVVRIVTIAYYLTFVVFVFALARRRVSAMVLMLPVLIAAVVFMPGLYSVPDMFNLNGTPSVTGMRFLPAAAIALVLAFEPRSRWVPATACCLLVVSSFWSLETFVFTAMSWGLVVFLEAVRERKLRDAAIQITVAIAAIATAQGAFALLVYIIYGHAVDFAPYVDLLLVFSSLRPNQIPDFGSWAAPIADNFLWWIPVWLTVFLTIAMATTSAVRGEPRGTVGRAGAMAAFCIAAVSYFAGRSAPPALGFAILPFASLMVLGAEPIILRASRYGLTGGTAFMFTCSLIALTFAFALERFSRPVQPPQGNSTILRHCFDATGCGPVTLAARLAAAPSAAVEMPYQEMYSKAYRADVRGRVDDLVSLTTLYAANETRVAALPDTASDFFSGYIAFSKTGKWYKWPIGSIIIEQQSGVNTRRILDAVKVHDGEILIVAKPDLAPLERKILDKIQAACRLAPVTETTFNVVYRVESCAADILDTGAR